MIHSPTNQYLYQLTEDTPLFHNRFIANSNTEHVSIHSYSFITIIIYLQNLNLYINLKQYLLIIRLDLVFSLPIQVQFKTIENGIH